MVRETDFAWARNPATADKSGRRDGVMRRAEWTDGNARARRTTDSASNRMDHGRLERLVFGECGQNGRKASRKHRLPCPRRANEKTRMSARGGNLERALGRVLSDDVREVGAIVGHVGSRLRGRGRKRPSLSDSTSSPSVAERRDESSGRVPPR